MYNLLFLKVFLTVFLRRSQVQPGRLGLAPALFCLFASGCAGLPGPPETPETFVLTGKVGVRQADESFSANLLWHQIGEGFEIDLWGPLGQGRVKLVKKDGEISLESDRGVLARGEPEAVMQAHLGWSLPLAVLPAWVQGGPLAGVAATGLEEDAEGRVSGFEQLGWQVALERYQRVPIGVDEGAGSRDLPRRITATRDDARVRLVVSEWRL